MQQQQFAQMQQARMQQQQGMGMMSQARSLYGMPQQQQQPQIVSIGGQQYQVVNIPENQVQQMQQMQQFQ
eukprot:CAMPEP_0172190574 /NCGR_PEP_ID=MMETSP1050-20130122/23195_1 /TAXON_ID=233186 /ORGANISM="Cryptomonas curvata, Strain CCAP979/52" /LENGTH=69 /DNA_ID=CAMNT_0012865475 /DNA_START=50 /DNA_END=259 /DNA_ORIENTATION=-